MLTLEDLLGKFDPALESTLVETYISSRWVIPMQTDPPPSAFEEIDYARLQLIQFLKVEMDANEDLVDIVLTLLDQIYGMREQMRMLQQKLAEVQQAAD